MNAAISPKLPAHRARRGADRRVAYAAALVGLILFTGALRLSLWSAFTDRAIDDIGQSVAAALAGAACAWRSTRLSGRARVSWVLLAAASFSWSAGEVVWSYYELIAKRQTPFPSLADLGFLLFPVFALAGLLLRQSRAYAGGGRIRVLLDGAMVACALFVVSWETSLGQVYHGGADSHFAFAVSLAYPVGDLLLVTTAVLVMVHSSVRTGGLVLVAGLTVMALADSGFSYLTATGAYHTGSLVDIGWVAAFLLIGVSALMDPPTEQSAADHIDHFAIVALPYVLVFAAGVFSVAGRLNHGVEAPALPITGLAFIALTVRQALTILDNHRLASSLLARQDELRLRAFHDGLTGLANRALFYDRLAHALELHRRDMRPVSIMYCDLDDFKSINDSFGHDAGDGVLVEVARRLATVVRKGDTLARLGGDEFAVLLEDDGAASITAKRLLAALDEPITIDNQDVPIRASIGVTTLDSADGEATSDQLLKQADFAMYAAKRAGKGTSVVYSAASAGEYNDPLQRRLAFRKELSEGRIGTALQPIVRMDRSPFGAEALARWNFQGVDVPPTEFVRMAERQGLLTDLDLLVTRNAIQSAVREAHFGDNPLLTTINLGLSRFSESQVCARLAQLLVELNMPASQVVVEITEQDLLTPRVLDQVVHELRDIGVGLAVDDFGTGQSSLSRLDAVRPDIVKLDRSFVEPLDEPGMRPTLVSAVIALAHDLGSLVIGEGIETERQFDVLHGLGCDAAQGYLLGRPHLITRTAAPALSS